MLAAMSEWSLFDNDDNDDDCDETNDHKKLWWRRRHDDVYHNVRWMTIECACYHSSTNPTRLLTILCAMILMILSMIVMMVTMMIKMIAMMMMSIEKEFLNFCPAFDKWPPFGQEERTLLEFLMLSSFSVLPFWNVQIAPFWLNSFLILSSAFF